MEWEDVKNAIKTATVAEDNLKKSTAIITLNILAFLTLIGTMITLMIRGGQVATVENPMNATDFFLFRFQEGWFWRTLPACFYGTAVLLLLGLILDIRSWKLKGINPKMYWQVLSLGFIMGMLTWFVILPAYLTHTWTGIEATIYPILLVVPFGFFAISSIIESSISLFGYN